MTIKGIFSTKTFLEEHTKEGQDKKEMREILESLKKFDKEYKKCWTIRDLMRKFNYSTIKSSSFFK